MFFFYISFSKILRAEWINETWHILDPSISSNRGTFRTLSNIYDEVFYSEPFVTMAYLDSWYIQNLSIFRTQDTQNTVNLWNTVYPRPCITLAYLQPLHIQVLAYWKPEEYSEPRQTWMMDRFLQIWYIWYIQNSRHTQSNAKHLWWRTLFRTMCHPSIFRTLPYSKFKEFSWNILFKNFCVTLTCIL